MNATTQRGAPAAAWRYQVCDLIIDVGRQRVTRAGAEIPLPRLSFDLLVSIVRAAPNVVSVHELMEQVWPAVVVSPETVSQRVKLLRDALGDDPRRPRYIAGIRGRGYRLIPDVQEAGEPHADTAAHLRVVASGAMRGASAYAHARRHDPRLVVGALSAAALLMTTALLVMVLRSGNDPPQSADAVTLAALPPRTVAVLPFKNLSADPANDYLAFGMAEMVLHRLAGVREIVVIARSSSFAFRDAQSDARAIGARLGARYLVEGSVQRDGERLRVTANLTDAESGSQLAALRFDRPIAELFGIQDEIAEKVADVLETRLADGVAADARGAPRSGNLEAYLAYLQGRALLQKWSAGDTDLAAEQFERAIALDPGFAAAYVGLAESRRQAAQRRDPTAGESDAIVRLIAPLIDKAIALDPLLGAAYVARAGTQKDVARIESDYRRGLELDPVNSRGLVEFSEFLMQRGRREESRKMLDRALLVDPLSARARYIKALDFSESSEAYEQALLQVLAVDPQFTSALARLGELRWARDGETAEGVKFVERAIAIDPETPWLRHLAYLMYLDMGDLAAAREVTDAFAATSGNARFQMMQYAGQVSSAGEAAYAAPAWLLGDLSNWNTAEAVRDVALATGDYRRAIRFIESACERAQPWMRPACRRHGSVPLAQLLKSSGEHASANKIVEEILAAPDRGRNCWEPDLHRVRGNALALLGRRDEALTELAEAFRRGDYRLWWYTIERDPVWAGMRGDAKFQQIAAEARAHAARQRKLLEDMRRKGEAPMRSRDSSYASS